MDGLPDDIINYIITDFINSYKSLYLMIQLNNDFFCRTIRKYKECVANIRYIIQDVPKSIISLFDHKSTFAELEFLELKDKRCCYLNSRLVSRLEIKDLSHSIMRGKDIIGKKYLCLKIIFKYNIFPSEEREIVLILYQNFLSYYNISSWSFGFNSQYKSLFYLLDGRLNCIKKLINREILIIDDYQIYLKSV